MASTLGRVGTRLLGAFIGAIIGAWLDEGPLLGLIAGAAVGYLWVEVSSLRARIAQLEGAAPAGVREVVIAAPIPAAPPPEVPPPARAAAQPSAIAPLPTPPPTSAVVAGEMLSAPTAAPPASQPTGPRPQDRFTQWLTGGNTVVRVGVVILFFGVAFLLKYAAEHTTVPIELRLAGVALGAIALLIGGVRLRRRREGYGLTLEGGAVGILYLVVFAALRLYALLPPALAFALLVGICALSAVLAVVQNSLALAVLGVAGGFLAPILASTGEGNHVMLFSYYAVLNAGILAIAWFRAWRPLNLVGFAFTFVIGALWGYRFYQPEFLATTEPFLVLFFLLYVAITLLFAWRQRLELRDPVDGALVFGVPIAASALQAGLVRDIEYGLAWSALVAGAFYLGLAALLLRQARLRLLGEAFLALGVIFATLTIPLALDGHWTAAAWAIEGAGILWVGIRQSKALARGFGLLLQVAAAFFFVTGQSTVVDLRFLDSTYLGALLISAAGFVSGLLIHRHRERLPSPERLISTVALIWSLLWWYFGTFGEIERYVQLAYMPLASLLFVAATTVGEEWFGVRLHWPALRHAAAFNLVLLALILVWSALWQSHPFADLGFVAWPLAIVAHYLVVRRHEAVGFTAGMPLRHAAGFWLIVAVIALEIHWNLGEWLPRSDWAAAAIGALLAGAMLGICVLRERTWPIKGNAATYLTVGLFPVVVLAVGWLAFAGVLRSGNPDPLPYLPILNPIDVAAALLLVALWVWSRSVRPLLALKPQAFDLALGVLAFAWVNAVLFRSLHHYATLPYTLDAMLASVLAQAAISIFWTCLALVLMLLAVRVRARATWVIGAALLGAVVVKLFLIDLSNTGTVARIVSFVVVGLLLLVIGYLAPVPPRSSETAEAPR